MLQMEDEVESKRAMSFDQTNQRFQHRNGQVYKLKVVSIELSSEYNLNNISNMCELTE